MLKPHWLAPPHVVALSSTREGGVSEGVYASLNTGDLVGDKPASVAQNRAIVLSHLPAAARIQWLSQVHGVDVLAADHNTADDAPRADASVTRTAGVFLAIMSADCLPVLFCDRRGSVVGAAHAGWRSLLGGVLENTVAAMNVPPGEILAWFGPAISAAAFEVGAEVREAFVARSHASACAFKAHGDRFLADLSALARQRLSALGVVNCFDSGLCTFAEPERFFSYRRDGQTGRMVSLVGLSACANP